MGKITIVIQQEQSLDEAPLTLANLTTSDETVAAATLRSVAEMLSPTPIVPPKRITRSADSNA